MQNNLNRYWIVLIISLYKIISNFAIEQRLTKSVFIYHDNIWAASWQNQRNDCVPSKDSDQPGHLPSLIRVFTVRMKLGSLATHRAHSEDTDQMPSLMWVFTVRTLILLVLSWGSSYEQKQPKSYKTSCASNKDSNQPAWLHCLNSVFAVQSMGSQGPQTTKTFQNAQVRRLIWVLAWVAKDP